MWTKEILRPLLDFTVSRLLKSPTKKKLNETFLSMAKEIVAFAQTLGVEIDPDDIAFYQNKESAMSVLILASWEPVGDIECVGGLSDGEVFEVATFCAKCSMSIYDSDPADIETDGFVGRFALIGWSPETTNWKYGENPEQWVYNHDELCAPVQNSTVNYPKNAIKFGD